MADKKHDDAAPADAHDEPDDKKAEPAPQPIIEDLLKDKTFDPDGKVRFQLAEISATQGIGKPAPAHLVDASGKPVDQPK